MLKAKYENEDLASLISAPSSGSWKGRGRAVDQGHGGSFLIPVEGRDQVLYFSSTMFRLTLRVGVISALFDLEIPLQEGDFLDLLIGGEVRCRPSTSWRRKRTTVRSGPGLSVDIANAVGRRVLLEAFRSWDDQGGNELPASAMTTALAIYGFCLSVFFNRLGRPFFPPTSNESFFRWYHQEPSASRCPCRPCEQPLQGLARFSSFL